jgi:aminoglycoside phosphotransferase (APT) family kinase protein
VTPEDLIPGLREEGLLTSDDATFTAFGGGVSSDVWKVEEGERVFVVKRSVSKLRVQAEWYSDPARLKCEYLYLQTVAGIVPGAVPNLLSSNPDAPYLAMEYLGEGYENWKARLLRKDAREEDARRAGSILGQIHAATRGDAVIAGRFPRMDFFTQLRIDAYLRATASKQAPDIAALIEAEANRLADHREALVHGDYSPKNMLTGTDRFVVLDCETACFGDPAFDLAFLLNHLCLKGLYHAPTSADLAARATDIRSAYRAAYTSYESHPSHVDSIEARTARLLPMLWLARVDGKSPVEYLNDNQRAWVRTLAPQALRRSHQNLSNVLATWFESLPSQ